MERRKTSSPSVSARPHTSASAKLAPTNPSNTTVKLVQFRSSTSPPKVGLQPRTWAEVAGNEATCVRMLKHSDTPSPTPPIPQLPIQRLGGLGVFNQSPAEPLSIQEGAPEGAQTAAPIAPTPPPEPCILGSQGAAPLHGRLRPAKQPHREIQILSCANCSPS